MEILEGLEIEDRVVVKGFIGLRDGKEIVPVEPKAISSSSAD